MSNESPRRRAVRSISEQRLPARTLPQDGVHASKTFGKNVFSQAVMLSTLPKDVYAALMRTVREDQPLEPGVADIVANAMKDWAIDNGATHYCHWFQPLTELTAEKHDSFLTPTGDGQAFSEFSGKTLIKGEPDASSLPSGGLRSTFEARGYTAWDPTSPAFLMEGVNGKTLCIPTCFCSYDGTALDKKTPLLRSLAALNKQALRILKLFGRTDAKRVSCTVGPEQEYFLIDRRFYFLRPDLINAGRTLFGARPPKGQEMEDHYFGAIKERVLAFMMDSERTLYELGIPIKTRHNEVAPGQFEIAPVFENSNLAADHNMLLMEVLKNAALKHGFKCLLHEKPFAGINGSGKHNNWSLADDTGNNLLDPGHTPHENAQFLVFLTAVIKAIHTDSRLMLASIASPANDHRLGANEAPPAIISIYLGDKLFEIVNSLIAGKAEAGRPGGVLQIGINALPPLPRDDSDRNRTSPFAFTGNKFEFRAIGSSQAIARPNTVLNTIVADALDAVATEIEKEMGGGATLEKAVQAVVQRNLRNHHAALFNGDNYSKAWREEASKRGLPVISSCLDAFGAMTETRAKELFAKHGVLSAIELDARYNIALESYGKTINVEAQFTSDIAQTIILPAALRYQTELAQCVAAAKQALGSTNVSAATETLGEIIELTNKLRIAVDALDEIRAKDDNHGGSPMKHARHYREEVLPAMSAVRALADALELIVADDHWPLPKYREMLFMC